MIKLRIAAAALVGIVALASCKKSGNPKPSDDNPTPSTPSTGTRLQLSLDSLYLYARETYLWYDAIPTYDAFNPRQYAGGDDYTSLTNTLYKITQLKINPATNKPLSIMTMRPPGLSSPMWKKGTWHGDTSGGRPGRNGNDLGFVAVLVTFASSPGTTYLYVRNVEKGSPADLAGLTRGCRIEQVNDAPAPTTVAAANNLMNSSTAKLKFYKPNATAATTVTINKAAYKNDPVVLWKVFPTEAGNTTGYIAMGHFSA